MASKLITDRQKSAEAVIAIIESQAAATGAALAAQLVPFLQGSEQVPDVTLLLQLLSRLMRRSTADLVAADKANLAELADDIPIRERRDLASEAVSSRIVALRETMTGAYGAELAARIFPGPTPSDATVLVRFAEASADKLEAMPLPPPRIPGLTLDTAAIARELRILAKDLDQALTDVAREAREAQATLVAKQRAMTAYDTNFTGAAALMGSVLTLTGQPELASRVRPSQSRPGRVQESDDSPDDSPDGEPDATP